MKKFACLLLLLTGLTAFAQGEANNWYFGTFAGMRFLDDGTVIPLSDSRVNTTEGCSTISDAQGNLLFYTDGRTIWDRNHRIMPNANYGAGTGLLGDPSSTQSAIIVPKKGNPDIYYVFTVDEPHQENAAVYPDQFSGIYVEGVSTPQADDGFNNGLNYSVIDLSVTGSNGSIGDVTTRNTHLLTYDPLNIDEAKYKCSEKITAVKNNDGTGFWVITHFINNFYSFRVDAAGVNETPVITNLVPIVITEGYRRNAIGYIKASPDGAKIAVAHKERGSVAGGTANNGAVYLYDFDDATGILSNPLAVSTNTSPYGIEFSAEAKKLYVSYDSTGQPDSGGVHQYDLLSSDIAASDIFIADTSQSGALQLGPNGKIYRANPGQGQTLDVINMPEEDGLLCDFQAEGQFIGGTPNSFSSLGLPPFITSLFSASIVADNSCTGQPAQFSLHVNNTYDTIDWNFGDGTPHATIDMPVHTYSGPGNYNVIATITRTGEAPAIISKNITVANVPVANPAPSIVECETDNDGITTFVLNDNTASILGTQNAADYEVKYYASQQNADSNVQALSGTGYTNAASPETIFARIQNKANNDCYTTTSFTISVSNTPVLNGDSYALCDDAADGDDNNGLATFNLNDVSSLLVQNASPFTITYYASQPDAQASNNALQQFFTNTTPQQQVIFIRVVNSAFPSCFIVSPITLKVNPLPPVANAVLVQCDTGLSPDGFTRFNLTEATAQFTAGNPDLTVEYYLDAAEAQNGINAITAPFTNTANPQQIPAKVTNSLTGCFRIQTLTLQVNTNSTIALTLAHCDDDATEDGFYNFTLSDAGLDALGDVAYYASVNDALLEQDAIPAGFTNTVPGRQSVFARIENNNNCTALQEIILIVKPLPDIAINDEAIVCLAGNRFITLDAGANGSSAGYLYNWSTGSQAATISVNRPGIYSVKVTNSLGCEKIRTITVAPSDVAVIDSIDINDLADNNTVTVHASPGGGVNTTYGYSLDLPDGPYQESNYFENVAAGIHTVYVYDVNGCGVVHREIAVLEIPKYFTPNGDGVNETWRVTGINSLYYDNSIIYIFDRYGKLLATPDPAGSGWDGTYNGHRLPSTDYWYVITLDNGRIAKGHFSMIR